MGSRTEVEGARNRSKEVGEDIIMIMNLSTLLVVHSIGFGYQNNPNNSSRHIFVHDFVNICPDRIC